MNEIRRSTSEAEEVARLAAIVKQHDLPSFVTGFEFRFGDVEGDPAVWVVFRTENDLPGERTDADRWIKEANNLANSLREHILESGEQRFPFFRFEVASPSLINRE